MIGLTPRQQDALDAIKWFCDETGVAPSQRALAAHMGVSLSTVNRLVAGLEERKRIRRAPRRKYMIELIDQKCPHCGGSLE